MNMKYLIVLILIPFISYGQQTSNDYESRLMRYILNPEESDSLCIKEISRAKSFVERGEIVFCILYPHLSSPLTKRHEKYIRELCKKNNLFFDYEHVSDIIYEGQTQCCFSAYMDKIIADKFGANFKNRLLAQADSMLLAANDTITYWLCDKWPRILGQNVRDTHYETNLSAKIPEKLGQQLKAKNDGRLPFMDIGFYIDKDGNASNYFLNYFLDWKTNQEFKDELFNLAVEKIKTIQQWETGIVAGQKVNTKNNVRVHFE